MQCRGIVLSQQVSCASFQVSFDSIGCYCGAGRLCRLHTFLPARISAFLVKFTFQLNVCVCRRVSLSLSPSLSLSFSLSLSLILTLSISVCHTFSFSLSLSLARLRHSAWAVGACRLARPWAPDKLPLRHTRRLRMPCGCLRRARGPGRHGQ